MTAFDEAISSPIFRAEDGREFHIGFAQHPEVPRAPPGAMWLSKSGSGLVVRTPGGDWYVDQPSSSGGNWTRSGEPPNVTANPSILQQNPSEYSGTRAYHGMLRSGVLEEC
jgi:hypothetical protein